MGEIADMFLDGTLDEETGEYIGDKQIDIDYAEESYSMMTFFDPKGNGYSIPLEPGARVHCPLCGRKVKAVGLLQHTRDKHEVPA